METNNKLIIIPETGFLRLPQVLQFIPFSKSNLWARVRDGSFPAPVKLGPRVTAWRVADIRALIERLSKQGEAERRNEIGSVM